jgi:outer membrane protein
MKKQVIAVALATLFLTIGISIHATAQTQKYAYVDSEYVLDNIPEYHDAQDELNSWSEKWQKEIDTLYSQIEQLYKKYQAEKVLLPDDVKKKREDEIVKKEGEMKTLQQKYFGPQGELYKKRKELVQPIQEKVYNAIESLAKTNNYAFVFDKSGGVTILYAAPKYDISDDVLDEVGTVMQTVRRDSRKKK